MIPVLSTDFLNVTLLDTLPSTPAHWELAYYPEHINNVALAKAAVSNRQLHWVCLTLICLTFMPFLWNSPYDIMITLIFPHSCPHFHCQAHGLSTLPGSFHLHIWLLYVDGIHSLTWVKPLPSRNENLTSYWTSSPGCPSGNSNLTHPKLNSFSSQWLPVLITVSYLLRTRSLYSSVGTCNFS